jgi:hypothetical protein
MCWPVLVFLLLRHKALMTSYYRKSDRQMVCAITGRSFVLLHWQNSEHVVNPEAARIVRQTWKRRSESEVVTSSDLTSIPVPDASCLAVADRAHLLPQLESASPANDSAASLSWPVFPLWYSSSLQPDSGIVISNSPQPITLIYLYIYNRLYVWKCEPHKGVIGSMCGNVNLTREL